MYIMDKPSMWEVYLHLAEFSYNNGHQSSLGMNPYRDSYDRECCTPISWHDPVYWIVLGMDMLKEMEKEVIRIEKKLNISHDW